MRKHTPGAKNAFEDQEHDALRQNENFEHEAERRDSEGNKADKDSNEKQTQALEEQAAQNKDNREQGKGNLTQNVEQQNLDISEENKTLYTEAHQSDSIGRKGGAVDDTEQNAALQQESQRGQKIEQRASEVSDNNPTNKAEEASSQPQLSSNSNEDVRLAGQARLHPSELQSSIKELSGAGAVRADISPEEQLTKATNLKDSAKALIQVKDFKGAALVYIDALGAINPHQFTTQIEQETRQKLADLKIMLLNNISHCKLNLESYEDSIWYAEKVVKMDSQNVKALFRIAMCYEKQDKNTEAFDKMKEVYRVHRQKNLSVTREISEAYERIKSKAQADLAKHRQQEKALFQRMITGKDDKKAPASNTKLAKQILYLLPSIATSYFIMKQGLHGNFASSRVKGGTAFLTFVFFGVFASDRLWIKGALTSVAALFTGFAYKYKLQ